MRDNALSQRPAFLQPLNPHLAMMPFQSHPSYDRSRSFLAVNSIHLLLGWPSTASDAISVIWRHGLAAGTRKSGGRRPPDLTEWFLATSRAHSLVQLTAGIIVPNTVQSKLSIDDWLLID